MVNLVPVEYVHAGSSPALISVNKTLAGTTGSEIKMTDVMNRLKTAAAWDIHEDAYF